MTVVFSPVFAASLTWFFLCSTSVSCFVPSRSLHLHRVPSPVGARLAVVLLLGKNETSPAGTDDSTAMKENEGNPGILRQLGNAMDGVVTNPLLGTVLFWAPFVANPNMRRRFSEFIPGVDPAVFAIVGAVAVGYLAYESRTEAVGEASDRRELALRALREAKARQLAPLPSASGAVTGDSASTAAAKYEEALRAELSLRDILPGGMVRIGESTVSDDPAANDSEDVAAARQFLGLVIQEDGKITPVDGKNKKR